MNEPRLVDANVFIRDLTAMKSMYDAISLDGMVKALKEAPTAYDINKVIDRIVEVRNNTPNTDFKNGCNECLYEIHKELKKEEIGDVRE